MFFLPFVEVSMKFIQKVKGRAENCSFKIKICNMHLTSTIGVAARNSRDIALIFGAGVFIVTIELVQHEIKFHVKRTAVPGALLVY